MDWLIGKWNQDHIFPMSSSCTLHQDNIDDISPRHLDWYSIFCKLELTWVGMDLSLTIWASQKMTSTQIRLGPELDNELSKSYFYLSLFDKDTKNALKFDSCRSLSYAQHSNIFHSYLIYPYPIHLDLSSSFHAPFFLLKQVLPYWISRNTINKVTKIKYFNILIAFQSWSN